MSGRWTIVEDVPQVSIAAAAIDFLSLHAGRGVGARRNVFFRDRFVETGPARSRLEFRLGIEQDRVAANAMIQTVVVISGVLARERTLCPRMARHFKLFRGQLLLPLGCRLVDLFDFDDARTRAGCIEFDNFHRLSASDCGPQK